MVVKAGLSETPIWSLPVSERLIRGFEKALCPRTHSPLNHSIDKSRSHGHNPKREGQLNKIVRTMLLSAPATRWTTRSLLTTPTRLSHLRFSSSASDASASTIATSFLSRFQSLGPQTRSQTLDANQLRLLSLTLNRPSLFPASPHLSSTTAPNNVSTADVEPAPGTPVPAGYHLVYFTPAFLENELGADGTDASYNPAHPFTRRMWAGGEVLWPRQNGQPNPLRVGDNVTETTRVLSAEPKIVRKTGEEMIVVGVEKEFSNAQGVAVVDRRYVSISFSWT